MEIYGDLAPESRTMASFSVPDDCCYLYDENDFTGTMYPFCLDSKSYGYKLFRLTNAENDTKTNKKEEREVLRNYWDLVVDSCIMARVEIVSLKWLEEDDIASASATR